jgi:RNA-splicing ligase RtcB
MTYLYEKMALEVKRHLKRLVPLIECTRQKAIQEAIDRENVAMEENMRCTSKAALMEDLLRVYKPEDDW